MSLLCVQVRRAALVGAPNQFETYVTLKLQSVKSSTTSVKGNNPAWETDFIFETNRMDIGLIIEVWNKGMLWDKLLGLQWMPLTRIKYTNESGDGQWLSLDQELMMEQGEVVGTKVPTGHSLLLEAHFELPCEDLEDEELMKKLDYLNVILGQEISSLREQDRRHNFSLNSGISEDSDYTSDVSYPTVQHPSASVHHPNSSASQFGGAAEITRRANHHYPPPPPRGSVPNRFMEAGSYETDIENPASSRTTTEYGDRNSSFSEDPLYYNSRPNRRMNSHSTDRSRSTRSTSGYDNSLSLDNYDESDLRYSFETDRSGRSFRWDEEEEEEEPQGEDTIDAEADKKNLERFQRTDRRRSLERQTGFDHSFLQLGGGGDHEQHSTPDHPSWQAPPEVPQRTGRQLPDPEEWKKRSLESEWSKDSRDSVDWDSRKDAVVAKDGGERWDPKDGGRYAAGYGEKDGWNGKEAKDSKDRWNGYVSDHKDVDRWNTKEPLLPTKDHKDRWNGYVTEPPNDVERWNKGVVDHPVIKEPLERRKSHVPEPVKDLDRWKVHPEKDADRWKAPEPVVIKEPLKDRWSNGYTTDSTIKETPPERWNAKDSTEDSRWNGPSTGEPSKDWSSAVVNSKVAEPPPPLPVSAWSGNSVATTPAVPETLPPVSSSSTIKDWNGGGGKEPLERRSSSEHWNGEVENGEGWGVRNAERWKSHADSIQNGWSEETIVQEDWQEEEEEGVMSHRQIDSLISEWQDEEEEEGWDAKPATPPPPEIQVEPCSEYEGTSLTLTAGGVGDLGVRRPSVMSIHKEVAAVVVAGVEEVVAKEGVVDVGPGLVLDDSDPTMSRAKRRWIGAFNKIVQQLNEVSSLLYTLNLDTCFLLWGK